MHKFLKELRAGYIITAIILVFIISLALIVASILLPVYYGKPILMLLSALTTPLILVTASTIVDYLFRCLYVVDS